MNIFYYIQKINLNNMGQRNKNTINGLSERHVSQIIRRNMIQRTEPNSKAYKREKYRYDGEEYNKSK